VTPDKSHLQVEVGDAEAYAFDDEPLIKAADMGFPDLLTIKAHPNQYLFKVESTGALHAYNIVLLAFDVLLNKLSKIKCE
jgi:DNA-directed RNA polymerase II subunit RPB3